MQTQTVIEALPSSLYGLLTLPAEQFVLNYSRSILVVGDCFKVLFALVHTSVMNSPKPFGDH